jgi:hypothetical protein
VSIHHLERAALTTLPGTKKLVLMCIADDADKLTRVAAVGLEAIQAWAGVGRSQALGLIKELVDEGFIERVKAGRKGQRAEFRVFSHVACCELHDAFHAPTMAAESAAIVGSATPDPTTDEGPVQAGNQDPYEAGSGQSDPKQSIGSDKGSDEGSGLDRTPYVSPVSTPLPPHSGGVVETTQSITIPAAAIDPGLTAEAAALGVALVPLATACPRHGATLTAACRGCGTTPRLVDNAQRRARAALARIREQQLAQQRRRETAAGVDSRDPAVRRQLEAAREQMRNQATGKESA